jgi:hypothetical protein
MKQSTLQLPSAFNKAPSEVEVERLVSHLLEAGDQWLTAAEIAKALGMGDRHVRKLAEHSKGRIISAPGCPGYRHINHTTTEQIAEIQNRLTSQAKAMIQRSILIGRLAHSIIR